VYPTVAEKDPRDLWLYDVASDKVRRLTTDGDQELESHPLFGGPDRVLFRVSRGGPERVDEIDLTTGKRRVLLREAGGVLGFGLSPDRSALAFIATGHKEPDGDLHQVLHVYCLADGTRHEIRVLPRLLETEYGEFDEGRVDWKSDGSMMLVTSTFTRSPDTVFVLRPDGTEALPPVDGTLARWSRDETKIYFRGRGYDRDRPGRWFSLDLKSGETMPLRLTPGTARPSISPDGRLLAHDDAKAQATVFVHDLSSGRERKIGSPLMGALWLSPTSLAVSEVRPCQEGECVLADWGAEGSVWRVGIGGGPRTALRLGSTVDADVLYR
jgi:Tol biopolymer transport system component